MGFGFVIIGYLTVLGVLPDSFIYYTWSIYIAVAGALFMLAGFCRLAEFNVYFAAVKYFSIFYVFILLLISPFVILAHGGETMMIFNIASKIVRICFLFVFHFYLFSGISALAKEIGNTKIEKKAKRNVVLTYIFFSLFIFELFNLPEQFSAFMALFGLGYFLLAVILLYSCYMRITYEGHDEAVEEKYKKTQKKFKKG
ncbi:MAG: hypothetical protein FWG34_06765 [Oscillospiraceae bacterium]|nr:hypothetical protein [Oscillospiraceae bacterium]